jgi:predicted NAD/FAD-dependent oxidoreductase
MTKKRIAIIGAGVAGLAAARSLTALGADVQLFERSAGVGGRLATRRVKGESFDHGAPFLSTNSERFHVVLEQWIDAGWVEPWFARSMTSDGKLLFSAQNARQMYYVGVPSMNAIAKHLAEGLAVTLSTNVVGTLRSHSRGRTEWWLTVTDVAPPARNAIAPAQPATPVESIERHVGPFDAIVVAAHPSRALPLVRSSAALTSALEDIQMLPMWVAMLDCREPLQLSADMISFESGPLASAQYESSKPNRSIGERWVLHSTAQWAQERLDTPKEQIAQEMLAAFSALLRRDDLSSFCQATAHRWTQAMPAAPRHAGAYWDAEQQIGCCGDWCNGVTVEAAYLSGLDLAKQMFAD